MCVSIRKGIRTVSVPKETFSLVMANFVLQCLCIQMIEILSADFLVQRKETGGAESRRVEEELDGGAEVWEAWRVESPL